jgi:hypothetical protein
MGSGEGMGASRPGSAMIKWVGKAARGIAWPCQKTGKGLAWLWSKLSLLNLFLVAAIAAAVGAYFLQRVAFPGAGSGGGQISATVYVETLPARVDLTSTFTPSAAINNVSLNVTVTGPSKRPDPWLLVVQCTGPSSNAHPQAGFWSEGAAGNQFIGQVLVVPGPTKEPLNFTCFTGLSQHGQTAATVVKDRDLNLSLPILEQNPDGQPMLAGAPLYAEKVAGRYKNLVSVQALPGTPLPGPCPVSTSRAVYPTPGTSSSPTSTSSPTGTSSSPPSGTSSATTSPSAASTTTSPTPSPSAVACYTPVSRDATSNVTPVKYSVPSPADVVTHEILSNVKLADERIDSMVPQGVVESDQVIWQGGPGLSPSLSATNLASAERQNEDAFWAGLLYGIAAALAVPFLQEFYKEWQKWTDGRGHPVTVFQGQLQRVETSPAHTSSPSATMPEPPPQVEAPLKQQPPQNNQPTVADSRPDDLTPPPR